jgi:FKBP-type peptidyl-prolyl cis-trans isomerase
MFKNNNMKKLSLLLFAAVGLLAGCVSDDENVQIILERDLAQIEKYVNENPIPSVKELVDNGTGIRIYWTAVSNSGKKPEKADTVSVNYTGKLLNNFVFDTSIESVARANNIFSPNRKYEPLRYPIGLGFTIPGFEFGILQMEQGDKATIIMPSLYGYGSQATGAIPANSPLIFELDMLEVKKIKVEDPLP